MNNLRYTAIGCALPVLFYVMLTMTDDIQNSWFAKGEIQQGHADLSCDACHKKTAGTYRQQIQANVHYQLGMRNTSVDFGYIKVSSDQCLSCHERPNERHPIHRFQEPRFASALKEINATSCLGCHSEHQDRRVNDNVEFCSSCHSDLKLKSDPIDVSHSELISKKQWDTCLGCHDFHGNHVGKPPVVLTEKHSVQQIRDYLASGPSPYGDQLHYEARKE